MKYLLDTHILLWAFESRNHSQLSERAGGIIADRAQDLYVSKVSPWEIAIKASLGKMNFLRGGVAGIYKNIYENGIRLLDLEDAYIKQVETLPFIHRDPFDRLLAATAIAEDMTIITADANIQKYDVKWVW